MNGITHFLVGIIITIIVWHLLSDKWAEGRNWASKEVFSIKDHPVRMVSLLRVGITSVLAFFSHIIVDGFAIFTYHPYTNFDNLFYKIWMPSILLSAAIVLLIALKKDIRYSFGMVFSIFFDLWDHSTLRVVSHLYGGADLGSLYLHQLEWAFIDRFLAWAPVLYLNPYAAVVEIMIISALLISWYLLEQRWALPNNTNYQTNKYSFIIIAALIGLWILLGEFF